MPATVTGLEHYSAVVLARVQRLQKAAGSPAMLEVAAKLLDQSQKRPFVIECSDDLVAALVTLGVVRISTHHIPLNLVIVGVDSRHAVSVPWGDPRAPAT